MSELLLYADGAELARGAADHLLRALTLDRPPGRPLQLCLTGGRIAGQVYTELAARAEPGAVEPGAVELWWSDERFVPTDDPLRNAGPSLTRLARTVILDPARTHPMPAAAGAADPAASAAQYADELGETVFDICLLGVGEDGHVAAIFPDHPSFAPTPHAVIGVDDAPNDPPQQISLSVRTLNRSREVWFLVSGPEKAAVLPAVMAGDPSLPGGVVRGIERTRWFVDADAAAHLQHHDCAF